MQEAVRADQVQAGQAGRPRAVPDLGGRVALITGGGRGLGKELCLSLAEAGAVVVAADIDGRSADAVANVLRAQGHDSSSLGLDVANDEQVAHALEEIVKRHGKVDVVVNNAGIDRTVSIEELSVAEWNRILAVNLSGPFIAARAAFPLMKRQGGGHIVNIVSTAAKRAWANAAAYHASKWGLLGLSYAMHVEGRSHGIKVTAVISGGLRTPFLLDRFPDIDLNNLQDPRNVADTVRFVLTQPPETVIPEMMVLPMRETSWP
jgi:NAD(P)-dependent dehydrogenase (short-subunit alcohol dehydrogenase family)